MGFDEFKKYHNANYHDGDSHFDERIYKKSNGDDFDCSFVQDCYDHFEAGAASRQGEVDELQRLLSDSLSLEESESIKFKMQANELQKRIDKALLIVERMAKSTSSTAMWSFDLDEALKGKKDE